MHKYATFLPGEGLDFTAGFVYDINGKETA
jgi:hypothetical protein